MNVVPFKRVFGLDFLRALAIFLVLLSHLTFLVFPQVENLIVTTIRIIGAIGVDLFFVLSGYLIGGILLKQLSLNKTSSKDLLLFWKRRWLRTIPNYYLVLSINVGVYFFIGKQLPDQLLLYIPFLQNFAFPNPDFFTESWSLSIEEYAYLLLPFILFLSFRWFKKINKQKLFLYVTIVVICLLVVLKGYYYLNTSIKSYHDWSSSFRKVVIYRIDSIYIGFVLVYVMQVFHSFCNEKKKHLLFFGMFIFIILHVIIFKYHLSPENSPFFYVFVYLQVVICSIAFVFPYFTTLNYSGIFFKPIQFLSIHSYAIYLVNYSIVLLLMQRTIEITEMSNIQKIGIAIAFLSITLFLSVLIYRFFELPILKYRDRRFSRN